jgi:microcystin degradation protein MlrC
MRIALGCFVQESHSFSPVAGSWLHFGPGQLAAGPEMIRQVAGARNELAGALAAAGQAGAEIAPLMSAVASASSGPVQHAVFAALRDELLDRLAAAGPIDGLCMVLHGAMVAEGCEDATGEVLAALRAAIGPATPLVATLDLHANTTAQMVAQATALAGYHTAPHVDQYETGQRAMSLLLAVLAGRVEPATALRRLPMILPAENGRTTEGPFSEVMAQVKALAQEPGILDASAFSVQPWLDVQDVGCSVVVIADRDRGLAEREADRLADAFWQRRRDFAVQLTPTRDAIRRALASPRGPFVLADTADAPSSGAPGDSTVVLRALLECQPERDCLLNIVDAGAVASMAAAGPGKDVTLQVGGRTAGGCDPVPVSGRVRLLADGDFVNKGPGNRGALIHRGLTAVLQIGRIFLVVMERPVIQWDPELYRSVGLEPADAQIVVVKSPAAFRAAYGPLAAEILLLDAAGICSPDLRSFPFEHARRPLYPLDDIRDWRAALGRDAGALR